MLGRLQRQLNDTYQADIGHDVRDYLITDPMLAKALSGGNTLTSSGETLLVSEDEDGLALSLYLEDEILSRLKSGDPTRELREEQLDDLCKVIEGVSHFNYVVWRAARDQRMTLLELELQAEVDKYLMLLEFAAGDSDKVHPWLFEHWRLEEGLNTEEQRRYETANDYASKYCRGLDERYLRIGRKREMLRELRRFYRHTQDRKLNMIDRLAPTPN